MHQIETIDRVKHYDLIICGGGLGGLTLARQLRLQLPELSIAVIDRLNRPLPAAAFKVGEATVETGSHYLGKILDLDDYLRKNHIRKLGLRYFFNDGSAQFQDRPELGLSKFSNVISYQLDRGILENDLRRFVEEAGVDLMEGSTVQDIRLSGQNGHHMVTYKDLRGRSQIISANWVVDAMGRRRYLQKKLKLTVEPQKVYSAAWFRISGRVDVSEFVPVGGKTWHRRVPDGLRYLSTNHLMGKGYWVWLIPLPSECTSIGIAAIEENHPFEKYNTYPLAIQWLEENEPDLAACLADREPMDFRCMRKYSYSSKQVFSIERWACVGDAAVFSDPFYALGNDFIGFSNNIITDMIRLDLAGKLTPEIVNRNNQFILSTNRWITRNVQLGYPFFDRAAASTGKLLWDFAFGWAHLGPQMYNSIYLDREVGDKLRHVTARFFPLTLVMQELFKHWAARSTGRCSFSFIDYLSVPILRDIQERNLRPGKSALELIEDQVTNLGMLEALAQALFLIAVEDVLPEYLDHFPTPIWLNAWGISLYSDKWHADKLFQPATDPWDSGDTRRGIRQLFTFN